MIFPSKIYVIYPLDEKRNILGAYVGMSENVTKRLLAHCATIKNDTQEELHTLMKKNGFVYQVLDDVNSWDDMHLEADWIDFFDHVGVRTFNQAKKRGTKAFNFEFKGGDCLNLIREGNKTLTRAIAPHWGGYGVVWRMEKIE